ncbi:hypothetical protein LTR95_010672 [Oleoguttula sp. CCFEE 5521]
MPRYTLDMLKKPSLYLGVAVLLDGTVHTYVGSSFAATRVKQRLANAHDRPLTYKKAGRYHAGLVTPGFVQYTANMVAKGNASGFAWPLMFASAVSDNTDRKAIYLLSQELCFDLKSSSILFFKSLTDEKKTCIIPVLELTFEI